MSKYKVRNVEELHQWLEVEITLSHIGFYILLGMIINSTLGWIVCGLLILTSLVWATKYATRLQELNNNSIVRSKE